MILGAILSGCVEGLFGSPRGRRRSYSSRSRSRSSSSSRSVKAYKPKGKSYTVYYR